MCHYLLKAFADPVRLPRVLMQDHIVEVGQGGLWELFRLLWCWLNEEALNMLKWKESVKAYGLWPCFLENSSVFEATRPKNPWKTKGWNEICSQAVVINSVRVARRLSNLHEELCRRGAKDVLLWVFWVILSLEVSWRVKCARSSL